MCGRYSVLTEDEIIEIRSVLHNLSLRLARDDLTDYETRPGEVRPTDTSPVITKNSEGIYFELAKFGFQKWDGKGVIINARSETIESKSMFSKLLSVGRCVVPAKEYYEWQEKIESQEDGSKRKPKKEKIKHFVKDKDDNLLFFAGLYKDTADGREFIIITKEASYDVTRIHHRMPVILRVDQIESWLNGELSPDDIVKMDFNVAVSPCEKDDIEKDRDGGKGENEEKDEGYEQMSMFE